jgi:hypothetical protein
MCIFAHIQNTTVAARSIFAESGVAIAYVVRAAGTSVGHLVQMCVLLFCI